MGSVYRARDLHFPNVLKLVAIKEMINNAIDPIVRQVILQNLEREANILVTLKHEGIPEIYDFFSVNERSYLVLEFINGQNLEAIIRQAATPLKEDQVIAWAIQVCDVLVYLHGHRPEPVIFRDIKPSNIMINNENQVVLVDFGIAKHIKAGQKGTMIGTEGFSPPEQYRGEATPQTDIYALGATLHHLLTNRDPRLEAPFSFKDRQIRAINPLVSEDMEQIVNRALEYEPSNRYKSAADMKKELVSLARKTGNLPVFIPQNTTDNSGLEREKWRFKASDEIRGGVAVCEDVVYFGAYDKQLYALNARTGSVFWNFETRGGIITRPLCVEKQVIFGSEDGRIYSANQKTGQKQWDYSTEGPIRSSAKYAGGLVFFGSDDKSLYAWNLQLNQQLWSYKAEGPIRSTPFLSSDSLFFGSESNEFICLNYRGQLVWRQWTKKPVTSSPVISDGIVFFSCLDGLFYALDAQSGYVFWRFRMGKGSISSPAIAEDLLFFGCADGNIYAVDRTRAREAWRFKTDGQVCGSPVVHNGMVYCGSTDGKLYAVNSSNGRLRWSYSTAAGITGTPVIFEDTLVFGSLDCNLYALDIS